MTWEFFIIIMVSLSSAYLGIGGLIMGTTDDLPFKIIFKVIPFLLGLGLFLAFLKLINVI